MLVHLRLPVVALCGLLLVAPERARERAAVPPAPPRFDVYGDPLPKGAVARVGTVRFRLPNPASNYDRQFFEGGRLPTERGRIAVSPDGRWLVTTAFGGAPVHVWELATGKLARVIDAPKVGGDVETVLALAFAPDSRLLVLTRAGALRACDPASGTWSEASSRARPAPSFDERGFESIPPCAAVSPDGTHFAFVGRGKPFSAEVLAADREKPVLRLRGAPVTPDVCQPALAPDNARLALPLADGTLGVFDVASGNAVGTWKGPDDSRLVVAAFAPNGRTVAGVFVSKHANLQHTHDWELVVLSRCAPSGV
jgi:hypothetical protein